MNFKKITSALLALATALTVMAAASCDLNDENEKDTQGEKTTAFETSSENTSGEEISEKESESIAPDTTEQGSEAESETQVQNPQGIGKSFFEYFDTVSYVYSYAGDGTETLDENCEIVGDILSEYHKLFDIYYEYSGINNLCTVNKNAGGEPIEVSPKLIEFLKYAEELYTLTNGKMNIMMGSVLKLWHDERTYAASNPQSAKIPTNDALIEASKYVGFEFLEIDEENNTVRITDKNARIDVGALGKGYATERAAEALIAKGVEHYVLNIGGNIRIIGTKVNGESWKTGIKNPENPNYEYSAYLNLADTSCVTSGDYERYFTVDGKKYHHIIDGETNMPAEYFSSITVICKDSGLADALSTALFCMSYEDGLTLVESIDGVGALWIGRDGEVKYSDGIAHLIIEK